MLTILLIEDHSGFRKCTRDYLEYVMHANVIESGDGVRAMEMMKRERPDVAIVDYNLPGMNGIEVTKALQLLSSGIRIVMMTGHDDEEIVRGAFDAGVSGFVTKQDSSLDLVECIETILKGSIFVSRSVSFEHHNHRSRNIDLHTFH